jgi:hypothetical protein
MTTEMTMTPCPDCCYLRPGHDVDSIHKDGRKSRGHGGPDFGPYLNASADEYEDMPGILIHSVQLHADYENITSPAELRRLATAALTAAEWLEARG